MTTVLIVILVAIVIVLGAGAAYMTMLARRRRLRARFGPEYDLVVAGRANPANAERELLAREQRHAKLELRPMKGAARDRYAHEWREVQAMFVTDPAAAVVAGEDLVTRLVSDRGYPTGDYEEQLSLLSVEHARTLGALRDAHDIYLRSQRGGVSTEELRQALVHYRAIFADVLDEPGSTIVDSSRSDVEETHDARL